MLDYENQMFLDILNEDGLVITAKGLGLEDVFLNLLKVYSDPGNLVLVLGTTHHEEVYFMERLAAEEVKPLPKIITSESGSVIERKNLYLQGGVLFLSPRILVVDLLKDRLPVAHITGIMVYRAHSIVKSCQEAFALRLYRQKNKTGFIKAFSNSPEAFTMGFCHVSRILKTLFLSRLYLWPRFQAIVQSSLSACKPIVVEMHVQLTAAMTRIQNAILELMTFTVKELKRINPSMDFEDLNVENAIAKSFHKVLQSQLDPVWHRLSEKTKVLVADLKILRVFLNYLTHYDCVTFNAFVSSFRTQSYALSSSGWLLLEPANVLFVSARQRVIGEEKKKKTDDGKKLLKTKKKPERVTVVDSEDDDDEQRTSSQTARRKKKKSDGTSLLVESPVKYSKLSLSQKERKKAEREKEDPLEEPAEQSQTETVTEGKDGFDPEPSPKWLVLKQILAEIKDVSKSSQQEDPTGPDKVLILVQDKRTAKQLQDFLVYGARGMLRRLHEKSSLQPAGDHLASRYAEPHRRSPTKLFEKYQPGPDEDVELRLNTQMVQGTQQPHSDEPDSPAKSSEKVGAEGAVRGGEEATEEYRDVYILTQQDAAERDAETDEGDKYQVLAQKLEELDHSCDASLLDPGACFQPPIVIIQTFKTQGNPLSLPRTLDEARPRFIVMYDVDVAVIRRVEVYQSMLPATQVHVYFVVFGGSVEEQAYLTALRREKEAFEFLINEKATMVIAKDQDGRGETCEALLRDSSKASDTVGGSSRQGGGGVEGAAKRESTIVVDMREFNSELPAMIHRRGIEVDPVTLQIGDYVLSPDICVERKSISDLIGSLNNGRLYNQAKAMTRYYTNPMLLIEFDQNKPMTLKGNYYISKDMSSNDVSARLILLTMHFPRLKIVWSPSPYATAQLFEELKQIREEPDSLKAASVGADLEQDLDLSEKYNPAIHDLVARLPGVTTKNISRLLNQGQSLRHLLSLSKEELRPLLGTAQDADCFHAGLHAVYNPAEEPGAGGKRGGAKRGRGFRR